MPASQYKKGASYVLIKCNFRPLLEKKLLDPYIYRCLYNNTLVCQYDNTYVVYSLNNS